MCFNYTVNYTRFTVIIELIYVCIIFNIFSLWPQSLSVYSCICDNFNLVIH